MTASNKKYYVVVDSRCGRAVPDATARADVNSRVEQWNAGQKDQFVTDIIGTEALVLCYRLAVASGALKVEDVQFFDDETPVDITPHGDLIDAATGCWPRGISTLQPELLWELVQHKKLSLQDITDEN